MINVILKELKTIEDFKEIENPVKRSNYLRNYVNGKAVNEFWTIDKPLLLHHEIKGTIIVEEWFINSKNELIYTSDNQYFKLEMYTGKQDVASYIKTAYLIEEIVKGIDYAKDESN
ncbi:hypothetical protein M2475_001632 [Breznakia sp. PF5-3]|uniref:hypothetical protein n=1 Tax=unclassified Breznakia TaxID=2623764 RepID=UPI0024064435|nr:MULTISPECIES: hypothetical protein [unclassified Breznakia]MDF9825198.1 hypothetical protein [Breznakia sp. PM6-1]MDF9836056.1 hypothetical protein [Breznakia sp. PF5-3]MDF9838872.1 hypothetical protein [Breznakia sp. PFB2-8]MDF9860898.1 hypothetical protein [Breznakia sp. PH5-24]